MNTPTPHEEQPGSPEDNLMTIMDLPDDYYAAEEPQPLSSLMSAGIARKTLPDLTNFYVDLAPAEFATSLCHLASGIGNFEEAFTSTAKACLERSENPNKVFTAIADHIVSHSCGSYIKPFVSLAKQQSSLQKVISLLDKLLQASKTELFKTLFEILPSLENDQILICHRVVEKPDCPSIHTIILALLESAQTSKDRVLARAGQFLL